MDEIHKLSPPGLLHLRPMMFVVEVITNLITKQVAGSRMMLKLVRALARYQKQVRDNEAYNLAVQIKAWVLAKIERRAWVRDFIGAAAIKRWQMRYDDLGNIPMTTEAKPARKPINPKLSVRPYTWNRYVLANISWLETKTFDTKPSAEIDSHNASWSQMRECRPYKSVEFWAFELADDYEPPKPGAEQAAKNTETPQTYSPPEDETETSETSPDHIIREPP